MLRFQKLIHGFHTILYIYIYQKNLLFYFLLQGILIKSTWICNWNTFDRAPYFLVIDISPYTKAMKLDSSLFFVLFFLYIYNNRPQSLHVKINKYQEPNLLQVTMSKLIYIVGQFVGLTGRFQSSMVSTRKKGKDATKYWNSVEMRAILLCW